jgi:OmpA-OmpF porin, OOP family
MRNPAIHTTLAGALLAATALFGTASAQTNPSAQQIINQLKPSGMLSDTTRGIKPLPPGGAESSSPGGAMAPSSSMAPMAAPPAEQQAAAPSANLDIDFQSGSAKLTPQAVASLDQLGKALTSSTLAAYNFKIVGHTDTVGDAATNQTLSEQRAAAVKYYLETKFNVPSTRLQSQGVGESDLLVQTPANTAEQQNRRVQVINLGQ